MRRSEVMTVENAKREANVTSILHNWRMALPYAGVGTLAGILIAGIVVALLVWRRRKRRSGGSGCVHDGSRDPEADPLAPHILVYPSYQGDSAPQLISKPITFKLPQMRRTESLDELLSAADGAPPKSKDQLSASCDGSNEKISTLHHRSNSFSWGYGGLGCLDPSLYRTTTDLEEELQYPEGHLGRVWFYVRYEPNSEKLLVTLLKIKNLPSRTVGTSNSCDPIVKLHLVPNQRRIQQSRQKKKTCNPFFDETFVFQVSEKELGDHSLKMTVLDSGRNKTQNTIGHVTFPLRHLAVEHPSDQLELLKMDLEKNYLKDASKRRNMFQKNKTQETTENDFSGRENSGAGTVKATRAVSPVLHPNDPSSNGVRSLVFRIPNGMKECAGSVSDVGELLVSLFYNENLHRLTVSVIAARNLKFGEDAEKEDSFVRLTLSQHCHTVKVKRTSTVRDSKEPKYSQGFNFRVPAANVHVTSLCLHVVQPAHGYGTKDKILGKCVLGSYMFARGKALTHWNSAFANPMEQIQNWHPLCQ